MKNKYLRLIDTCIQGFFTVVVLTGMFIVSGYRLLKNFLCKHGYHWWKYLPDDTRKCQWCPKHQEIEDWDAGVMGGIDIDWRDIK